MKFSFLLTLLLIFVINHCVADDYDVEYKTKTSTIFKDRLSPHHNCYAISGAYGLAQCIQHCADWTGKRCFGFAYDNVSCWVCNYSPVPYQIPATLVAKKADMFWMRDGRQGFHTNTFTQMLHWPNLENNICLISL